MLSVLSATLDTIALTRLLAAICSWMSLLRPSHRRVAAWSRSAAWFFFLAAISCAYTLDARAWAACAASHLLPPFLVCTCHGLAAGGPTPHPWLGQWPSAPGTGLLSREPNPLLCRLGQLLPYQVYAQHSYQESAPYRDVPVDAGFVDPQHDLQGRSSSGSQ